MRIIIFKLIFIVFCGLITTTSCQQYELLDLPDMSGNPLQLQVSTKPVTESRGLVTSAYLPSGSRIGLSITDGQGASYMGAVYANVMATAFGSNASQKYVLDTQVVLGDESATVHAYYPWTDNTDITAVPVTTGETDYMFADRVTGINASNPQASLVMQHALAAVRVNIARGTFSGTGAVSGLSVSADNIAMSGELDATTGTLSGFSGSGEPVSKELSLTLDDGIETDFIVVPTTEEAKLQVCVNIDGKDYTISTGEMTLQQGYIHTLDITVDNEELSWTGITVDEWGYDSTGNPVIPVKDKNITITGDYEGIAFNNTVNDDGTVTIVAVPTEYGKMVEEVTCTGGSLIKSQFIDEMTGIRTIVLYDILADTDVVFNGLYYSVIVTGDMDGLTYTKSRTNDGITTLTVRPIENVYTVNEVVTNGIATFSQTIKSSLKDNENGVRTIVISQQQSPVIVNLQGCSSEWFTAIYEVVSTTEPTPLFRPSGLINVHKLVIEGVEYDLYKVSSDDPFENWTFTSTGRNEVKFTLYQGDAQYRTTSNLFYGIKSLVSISIPDVIHTIGYRSFYDCSSLEEIIMHDNVTIVEDDAFYNCSAARDFCLPTNLKKIGQNAFSKCSGINGEIVLNNVETGGGVAFSNCSGIESIIIGDKLNKIGQYCFYECTGMESANLGSNITEIGDMAFRDCSSLGSIEIHATTAPTITNYTFIRVKSNGVLTIPVGSVASYSNWLSKTNYYLGSYNWSIQESIE